ncbi:hypothetical protein HNQ91_003355 [Filimonas zeae]|uniref:Molybdopterin-binding protein n=1 Tax=Filimonas zeae TaxID=1737353 RepID=A0A917MYS1_9BACT|nr:molybdopterin-binding protein [Filimonas zeae]MDR6340290.1 hypothetical protein [Filimonas zeae]GGH72037.1 hypothetical protein GCM10011379_32030 [Filimonas zeae]
MRLVFILFLTVLSCQSAAGQHSITVSDTITVTVSGKHAGIITAAQLQKLSAAALPDVVIRNHNGVPKDTLHGLKGVLLKDLLRLDSLLTSSPKLWSTYYLSFVATDGYTVVFSWNELFNSPAGANTWLLTAKNGVALPQMHDHIAVLCTSDANTGRRFVKGLREIRVISVQ